MCPIIAQHLTSIFTTLPDCRTTLTFRRNTIRKKNIDSSVNVTIDRITKISSLQQRKKNNIQQRKIHFPSIVWYIHIRHHQKHSYSSRVTRRLSLVEFNWDSKKKNLIGDLQRISIRTSNERLKRHFDWLLMTNRKFCFPLKLHLVYIITLTSND